MTPTTHENVIEALEGLIKKVRETPERITFDLNARIYPELTHERIEERERGLKAGYVVDVTSPLTIQVSFDGRP